MSQMNKLDWTAAILLIIGGINWGLVALNYNLVTSLLGSMPTLVKIIYGLVGLSAVYSVFRLFSK